MQIRAPITVNILIDTVDSTVSGIFMPKRRIDITVEWFAKLFEVKKALGTPERMIIKRRLN